MVTMNEFGITEAMEGDTVEILTNVGWRKMLIRTVGTTMMTYYDMDGNPGSIGMNQLRGLRAPMETLTGQDTLIINGKPIPDPEVLMVERWPCAFRETHAGLWQISGKLFSQNEWERLHPKSDDGNNQIWPYHPGDKLPL